MQVHAGSLPSVRVLDPRPNAEFNTKYPFSGVLPSPVAPSDHVLIAAEFDMVGR